MKRGLYACVRSVASKVCVLLVVNVICSGIITMIVQLRKSTLVPFCHLVERKMTTYGGGEGEGRERKKRKRVNIVHKGKRKRICARCVGEMGKGLGWNGQNLK